MPRARAAVTVPGLASGAEALWYDPQRWAAWIDGFGHVARLDDSWPRAGAVLDWDSKPGGRGRVREKVLAYEARSGQELAVEDERLHGTQAVRFEPVDDGVRIALELRYELKQRSPLTPLTDLLFIRRALRESLRRSLQRFARERRAELEMT
ncbi:MAG TPA: SRPBCC family protein [Solirubrobacteraceae bacterium]|nr:SRPBCC family protein [Solirubrobacteraceae bacterium]